MPVSEVRLPLHALEISIFLSYHVPNPLMVIFSELIYVLLSDFTLRHFLARLIVFIVRLSVIDIFISSSFSFLRESWNLGEERLVSDNYNLRLSSRIYKRLFSFEASLAFIVSKIQLKV